MNNDWSTYLVSLGIIALVLAIYHIVIRKINPRFLRSPKYDRNLFIIVFVFLIIFNIAFGVITGLFEAEFAIGTPFIGVFVIVIISLLPVSVLQFINILPPEPDENSEAPTQLPNLGIMFCKRCGKKVLTHTEFTAKLNAMGLNLNPGGNITASGVFNGYGELQNMQQTVAQMESDKAIQCKSCGKIYCVDCLAKYAPLNVMSGGKMCPSCGGSFKEI